MPRDLHGLELRSGDCVLVPCQVISAEGGTALLPNLWLVTEERVSRAVGRTTLFLNARQVYREHKGRHALAVRRRLALDIAEALFDLCDLSSVQHDLDRLADAVEEILPLTYAEAQATMDYLDSESERS